MSSEIEAEITEIKGKKRRKSSEKRKLKSRDAARNRRGKESEYFDEINELLPLPASVTANLDKSTSLRLFIAYIKLKEFLVDKHCNDNHKRMPQDAFIDRLYPSAIDGFVLLLTLSGNIVFLSDNVKKFLGIPQIDMVGHSLYDFSHPCDHEEIKGMLHYEKESADLSRLRLLRIRCTPNKRETRVKKVSYKVMRCVGKMVGDGSTSKAWDEQEDETMECVKLISIASPIPHPSNVNILLDQTTFLSRHNVDMKFTYVDSRVQSLFQYETEDLLTNSLFMYVHAADIINVQSSFKELLKKGQCDTNQYRFMVKNGGFVWIVTQATLIYGNKTPSYPQCVVCVHYVNSNVIDGDKVFCSEQLSNKIEAIESGKTTSCVKSTVDGHVVPLQSTDSIFSPRTKDMNTGYLTMKQGATQFQEFKDDPEDLTHLAPTAGDACIPLEVSALDEGQLKDWIVMDTALEEDELSSLDDNGHDHVRSSMLDAVKDSLLKCDPFLSYRDDNSFLNTDSHKISPSEPISIGCSSDDGSDIIVDSNQSPNEFLDTAYNLPIDTFPTLSVTDQLLWNATDATLTPSYRINDVSDDESSKCSSLAKLLQMESCSGSAMNNNQSNPNTCRTKRWSGDSCSSFTSDGSDDMPIWSKSINSTKSNRSKSVDNGLGYQDTTVKSKRHRLDSNDRSKLKKRQKKETSNDLTNKSVLMSLLMDGQNAEYICDSQKTNNRHKTSSFSENNHLKHSMKTSMPVTLAKLLLSDNPKEYQPINQLMYLTCKDAEVNAPIQQDENLLSGAELLNALEYKNPTVAAEIPSTT